MGLTLFRKLTLWAGAAVCLSLLVAVPTNAQVPLDPTNVHIDCGATPNCTGGTSAVIDASETPTFSITENSNETGTLFLVILVPNYTATGFTSGTLWTFLGIDANSTASPNFNAFASDSSTFGNVATPTGFTVTVVNLGAFNNSTTVNVTPSGGPFPAGTMFYAYVQSAEGTTIEAINSTPITPSGTGGHAVPEPASMAMFGTGLLVLGGAIRRRWQQR